VRSEQHELMRGRMWNEGSRVQQVYLKHSLHAAKVHGIQ
jgi:hypothetical protein